MGVKGQRPTSPDDHVIQEIEEKAYRIGWEERKGYVLGLIEGTLRKSQDFEEFSNPLREMIAREEGRVK